MTQKLLIMERDTKEELEDAIRKHLEDSRFRVVGFSVLESEKEEADFVIPYYEAWIVIDDTPLSIGGTE